MILRYVKPIREKLGSLGAAIRSFSIKPEHRRLWFIAACSVTGVFIVGYSIFFKAPADFPEHAVVTIAKGSSLAAIADQLKDEDVIKSPFWFRSFVTLRSGQRGAVAGSYYFAEKESAFSVAWRIATGRYEMEPIKITIPEGSSSFEIAAYLEQSLAGFDRQTFLPLAKEREGYLFPDTYLFAPDSTAEEVIAAMESNFAKRTASILPAVEKFGKSLHEVVTMASLLEEEARTLKTRRTVAGILWARLEYGMPLQVDAVFPYIIGKNTYEVTLEDLAVDSPYNTYKYPGLPPAPITNPGLESIQAAITPIETEYMYYLSDRAGRMYYAETFEEHVGNKRYLDRM